MTAQQPQHAPVRLLIAEKSENAAHRFDSLLRDAGIATRPEIIDLSMAAECMAEADMLLCNAALPDLERIIPRLSAKAPHVPIIVVTNAAATITSAEGLEMGAADVVADTEPKHLVLVVKRELAHVCQHVSLKKTRRALEEVEQRCQLLLEGSKAAIAYVHEGMHIHANESYLKLFGYADSDDLLGLSLIDLLNSDSAELLKKMLKQFRQDEVESTFEFIGESSSGETVSGTMTLAGAEYEGEHCLQITVRTGAMTSADVTAPIDVPTVNGAASGTTAAGEKTAASETTAATQAPVPGDAPAASESAPTSSSNGTKASSPANQNGAPLADADDDIPTLTDSTSTADESNLAEPAADDGEFQLEFEEELEAPTVAEPVPPTSKPTNGAAPAATASTPVSGAATNGAATFEQEIDLDAGLDQDEPAALDIPIDFDANVDVDESSDQEEPLVLDTVVDQDAAAAPDQPLEPQPPLGSGEVAITDEPTGQDGPAAAAESIEIDEPIEFDEQAAAELLGETPAAEKPKANGAAKAARAEVPEAPAKQQAQQPPKAAAAAPAVAEKATPKAATPAVAASSNGAATGRTAMSLGDFLADSEAFLDANKRKTFASVFIAEVDNYGDLQAQHGLAGAEKVCRSVQETLSTTATSPNMPLSAYQWAVLIVADNRESATTIANEFRSTIENLLLEVKEKTVRPSVTLGGAELDRNGTDSVSTALEATLDAAFSTTQAAIEAFDGNHVELPSIDSGDEDFDDEATRILTLINEGIEQQKFMLLFQPIISLRGDSDEHYEVFLRMMDRSGEKMAPNEFLRTAIDNGVAGKIDRWVILQSIKLLSTHRSKGNNTRLTINVTSNSVADAEFIQWLGVAVKAARLPSDAVIFQITERDAATYIRQTREFVEGLKAMHCRSSLSRFGLADDPFEILRHIPVDFVKLDGSHIEMLSEDPSLKDDVTDMIQKLQGSGKLTIVPMVESANVLSALWQAGANYIQGHYLQEPSSSMDYDFSTDD